MIHDRCLRSVGCLENFVQLRSTGDTNVDSILAASPDLNGSIQSLNLVWLVFLR